MAPAALPSQAPPSGSSDAPPSTNPTASNGGVMTLGETLVAVWKEVLIEERGAVEVGGKSFPVTSTPKQRLRTVYFQYGSLSIMGIEQNPEKPSRWGTLARSGARIMQFSHHGRYVANVCDGSLTRYPAWRSANLPE